MSAMASTRAADADLEGQRASKVARIDEASSSAAETRTAPSPRLRLCTRPRLLSRPKGVTSRSSEMRWTAR